MQIHRIDHIQQLLPFTAAWTRLIDCQDECSSIFLTPEWLLNWWRWFGRDKRLVMYMFFQHDRLIGLMPLMIAKSRMVGVPIRVLKFMGSGHADHLDFCILPQKRAQVLGRFTDLLIEDHSWDLLDLTDIPNDSPNLDILIENLNIRNIHHRLQPAIICPYLKLNGDSWESFYSSRRSRSSRQDLKRRMRRFMELGRVSFRRYSEPEAIRDVFPQLFEIYRRRWNGKYLSVSFADRPEQDFYRETAVALATHGRLHLLTLELDDSVTAFSLSAIKNSRFTWLITAYDPAYSRYFAGELLLTRLLEDVFDSGTYREFDFTRGEEPYKFKWTSDMRQNLRLVAAGSTMLKKMLFVISCWNHKLRCKARESAFLRNIKLNGIGKLQRLAQPSAKRQ
ncbi:MAG: GNAT family N-acetyltransferase [Deltaproteobacteria bacterium]|nr:GNAT family N-acetyltransferase [Deltaproteobacteria bacterium]MBW2150043.1 GNAT family N-acetyltransferase [Deltaproteobacteria bacterium]